MLLLSRNRTPIHNDGVLSRVYLEVAEFLFTGLFPWAVWSL